mmetsp:Transcript_68263/g.183737  ORF Transcript_68263/g.183737 Transcript_68263/m.183737 type:complete len:97 (+) Transcript_68263:5-295(+)
MCIIMYEHDLFALPSVFAWPLTGRAEWPADAILRWEAIASTTPRRKFPTAAPSGYGKTPPKKNCLLADHHSHVRRGTKAFGHAATWTPSRKSFRHG